MIRKKKLLKTIFFITMIFYMLILSGKFTEIPAGTSERGFYNMKYLGLTLFLGFLLGILVLKFFTDNLDKKS